MANVGTAPIGKTLVGGGNGSSPTYVDIGTNSGLTAHGVVIAEGNSAFTATAVGTAGQVLTSNGAGLDPTFQTPATGGISTINGDSGSISGATVTLYANTAAQNAGSTVKFVNSGTTSTLNVTDNLQNTIIGSGAGNATLSQGYNVCVGKNSGKSLTSGNGGNTLIGWGTGQSITTGDNNIAVGQSVLGSLTSGLANVAMGGLSFLTTGSYNLALGTQIPGQNYTTESSNIVIGNDGVVGDYNTIRIGTQGNAAARINKCFIAGIVGVTTSNSQMVTIDSTSGQLGVATIPSGAISFIDQGTSITLAANTGYFVTAATTQTLPASPSQGDLVVVACDTAGTVVVTANTGQTIRLGSSVSSTAGTLTSTALGDSLTLRYRSSNSEWFSVSSIGTWTVA